MVDNGKDKMENEQRPEETANASLALVPRNIGDLMVRPDALQVLERQVKILQSLRRASIAMTFPEDWLLFRAEDQRDHSVRQYGYLQDKGCQRIRDLWGIDTKNIGPRDEKGLVGLRVDAADGSFSIVMIGDGYCFKTGQTLEAIEGGRSSRDDAVTKFVESEQRAGRQVSEAQLDLTVRKNARANLEGNIVRRLTGMSGVTVEELADCWKDGGKDVKHCVLGRGYGQGQQAAPRAGSTASSGTAAPSDYASDPPPPCSKCGGSTRLIPAGKTKTGKYYSAFWGCEKRDCKGGATQAKEWHEQVSQLKQDVSDAAEPAAEEPIQF